MAKQAEATISKSDAIRQTIAAGIENPTEGVKHIKETFGLDVKTQVFSTLKSQTMKKAMGKKITMKAPATPKKSSSNGHAANPADLARQVKLLVAAHGADAVKGMVEVFAE